MCLVLGTAAWAQPAQKCAATAELQLRIGKPDIAVLRLPVTMRGTGSQLIRKCGVSQQKQPMPFTWKVQGPDGKAIAAQDTNTLQITFTPTQVGPHKVTLIGCPQVCKVTLISVFKDKPIKEVQNVGPEEKTLVVDVAAEAQLPPLFTPPTSPGPLVSDGAGGFRRQATTRPGLEQYQTARDACSDFVAVGSGTAAQ